MKALFLILISSSLFASNILVIGDSHMAGPFGNYLHKNLKKINSTSNLVTLGHASSSSLHWMSEKDYKLSGGVFHKFSNSDGKNFNHPNPTHWREKVLVPKFEDILNTPFAHNSWTGEKFNFDTVIIELGANDARAISDQNGKINPWEYEKRQGFVKEMLEIVEQRNLKCFWIGPPNGIKKTQANQSVLYQMLEEVVIKNCSFFSSNHYKATGCDGVHFNCRSEKPKAKAWANEVSSWIANLL